MHSTTSDGSRWLLKGDDFDVDTYLEDIHTYINKYNTDRQTDRLENKTKKKKKQLAMTI